MAGTEPEGSGGEEGWPSWLCDAVSAVHGVLDSAETAPQVGTQLPDALTNTPAVELAWIGAARAEHIRVRSVPSGLDAPSTVSVDGETLTERVESTDRVQVRTDATPDIERVLSQGRGNPTVASFVGIPLRTADASFGVLHLCLDREASHETVLASLGRAIGRRLQAFETAEQLERERRRLEEMRSLHSHDLGNPLNIASGRIELTRVNDDLSHLDSVDSALERIDALIDRGVRLAEVGQQPVHTASLSLASVAHDSWDDVAQERGELVVEDATLDGERERVRMLLNELFRNALAHSDGSVTVEVGPLSDVAGFFVTDDGCGIPEDEREYVFDTGYTTDPDRDGLGLSVVTEIAGAHGWDVTLGPADPAGTRVEVVTSRW